MASSQVTRLASVKTVERSKSDGVSSTESAATTNSLFSNRILGRPFVPQQVIIILLYPWYTPSSFEGCSPRGDAVKPWGSPAVVHGNALALKLADVAPKPRFRKAQPSNPQAFFFFAFRFQLRNALSLQFTFKPRSN